MEESRLVSGGVNLNTDIGTSADGVEDITTDATIFKAGWYSDNFDTWYLDEDGIKHYQ